jgi:hypothetical protein
LRTRPSPERKPEDGPEHREQGQRLLALDLVIDAEQLGDGAPCPISAIATSKGGIPNAKIRIATCGFTNSARCPVANRKRK